MKIRQCAEAVEVDEVKGFVGAGVLYWVGLVVAGLDCEGKCM